MSVVDEIKSRLDIIDLISGYVPTLHKAGRTYKGLCPFHSEKTPSFVVYPDSQTWHCFGACGIGGDMFSFLMRREGYEFKDALRDLAARAGVALEERSPEVAAADERTERLLEIVSVAAAYFHDLLEKSPQAEFARSYIAGRGLGAEIIQKFQLGYAPNGWEGLKTHLAARGYAEKDMVTAGLLVERDDGSSGYDRFRDRFVTPIRDGRGRVIGFGARALHDNQVPKYLNSPQTPLFDKSAVLYGLDVARDSIRSLDQAVIVEGYMDVLQAHQQGYTNVVAQMGTALTEQQLKLLKRYTNKFILALDADTAGSAATLSGVNAAREALDEAVPVLTAQRGMIRYEKRLSVELRIASMPVGKDPDDFLRHNPENWPTLVEQARPLVDYYIEAITADLDLATAKGKSAAVQRIMPVIRELGDAVEQDHYLQQLARLVRIDERTLRTELERQSPTEAKAVSEQIATKPVLTQFEKKLSTSQAARFEEYCLAMLIGHPTALEPINQRLQTLELEPMTVADFLKTENGALFQVIERWTLAETQDLDGLLALTEEHLEGHLASMMALWHQQPATPDEYIEKELMGILVRMRRDRLTKQSQELRHLQNSAYEAQDKEAGLAYTNLIGEVKARLSKLDKARDALSIMGRRRQEERYSL